MSPVIISSSFHRIPVRHPGTLPIDRFGSPNSAAVPSGLPELLGSEATRHQISPSQVASLDRSSCEMDIGPQCRHYHPSQSSETHPHDNLGHVPGAFHI